MPFQHLVQQQDLHLFCPRYDSNNDKRIQFCNEKTGEIENTRDHEVFIKLLIGNRARAGHHDGEILLLVLGFCLGSTVLFLFSKFLIFKCDCSI